MRFPTTVTIVRPSGVDEYGNPDKSFTNAQRITTKALRVSEEVLFVPKTTNILTGDRIELNDKIYDTETIEILSPAGVKVKQVKLQLLGLQ